MLFRDAFHNFFTQSALTNRVVTTLGPSGTSSYAAAVHFTRQYPLDILLFPTYEVAADAVRSAPDLDGTVQAKKYYAVDLQRKIWFGGSGEVKDADI